MERKHFLMQAAVTGTLSVAERSHPTSEVRGSSREDSMPQGWQPRGVTPRPRSGAAGGRSYPTPPCPRLGAVAGRSNPTPRPGAVAGRTKPTPSLHGHRRA